MGTTGGQESKDDVVVATTEDVVIDDNLGKAKVGSKTDDEVVERYVLESLQ